MHVRHIEVEDDQLDRHERKLLDGLEARTSLDELGAIEALQRRADHSCESSPSRPL